MVGLNSNRGELYGHRAKVEGMEWGWGRIGLGINHLDIVKSKSVWPK